MSSYKKPSILMQLILLIAVITFIPVTTLAITTYTSYKQTLLSRIIATNFDTLNQAEQNISNLVKNVTMTINHFDNNSAYYNQLTQQQQNAYDDLTNIRYIEHQLDNYLSDFYLEHMDIILIGANKTIYSTSDKPPKISVDSVKRTYWYEKTANTPQQLSWFIFDRSYFNNETTHPVLVAAKNLYDYTSGELYGTIILEVDEYHLYDLYKDITSDHEIFMIQDSEGNVITTSDRTVQLSLNSAYSAIDLETTNLIYDYDYKGQEFIYLSQASSISDWMFIKLLSTTEINSEIHYLQRNFIVIYALCMMLILIGVYIVGLRITKPIKSLTHKIQANYLHHSYSSHSSSMPHSISVLTSYEDLIAEVDDTVGQLIEYNEARMNAEMHALRMQINPHFLYNTLNSIKNLVWLKKTNLIEPTITSLVKLLQQTIRTPNQYITLSEEIKLLEHYIYIQNIRRDDTIRIKYNLKQINLTVNVPSLILQPIVENSIFHGIEPSDEPGIITISGYYRDKDLYIEVVDNGVGIPREKIHEILSMTSNEKHTGFNGIGVANINQRLKLFYGEAYGIKISSQPGIGTSVTLRIKV